MVISACELVRHRGPSSCGPGGGEPGPGLTARSRPCQVGPSPGAQLGLQGRGGGSGRLGAGGAKGLGFLRSRGGFR